jgi:hypothetical protein
MRIVNEFVMFTTGPGGTAKLRETKHGVFVAYGRAGARFKDYHDEIILSKNGDHIKYGVKLAKRNRARQKDDAKVMTAYGTLKTHAYTSGGEMVQGFMRDTARAYPDPLKALLDDRYAIDGGETDPDTEGVIVDNDFVAELEERNGVAALIMTRS